MNYYSLNISETYILNSTKPMKFDELLKIFLPLASKFNGNTQGLVAALNKEGFITSNIVPPSTGGQPLMLDRAFPYKSIRFMAKQRILLYMDGNYEFVYNMNAKFMSISSNTPDYRILIKQTDVKNLVQILTAVRENMSGLCEFKEVSPQKSVEVSRAQKLAEAVNSKKKSASTSETTISASNIIISKEENVTTYPDKSDKEETYSDEGNNGVKVKEESNTIKDDAEALQNILDSALTDGINTDLAKGQATE